MEKSSWVVGQVNMDHHSDIERVDRDELVFQKREERLRLRKEAIERMGLLEDFTMTPEERKLFGKVEAKLKELPEILKQASLDGLSYVRLLYLCYDDVKWSWEGPFFRKRASVKGYSGLKRPSHRHLWNEIAMQMESPFIEERENGELWISVWIEERLDYPEWLTEA